MAGIQVGFHGARLHSNQGLGSPSAAKTAQDVGLVSGPTEETPGGGLKSLVISTVNEQRNITKRKKKHYTGENATLFTAVAASDIMTLTYDTSLT